MTIILALVANAAVAAPMEYRPKNFFSAVWAKDKEICETVLQSLNKEYLIPKDLYSVLNPNFITDLLLTSDSQVKWRHRSFDPGGPPMKLDYATVDLANDGYPIPVVRWSFYDSSGYRNELFLPSVMPDEITSEKSLPGNIVPKYFGADAKNELKIGVKTSDFWETGTYPSNGMFDFNLLEVGNKIFLLGAGSQDAARTVMHGGGFNAFVMEYRSMQNVSVVCHFRGGEKASP